LHAARADVAEVLVVVDPAVTLRSVQKVSCQSRPRSPISGTAALAALRSPRWADQPRAHLVAGRHVPGCLARGNGADTKRPAVADQVAYLTIKPIGPRESAHVVDDHDRVAFAEDQLEVGTEILLCLPVVGGSEPQ
jgi:hypothetical protein